MTGNHTLRDKVVLLFINGMSSEAAESFCLKSGIGPEEAQRVVADARKRITVAADYTRDEQIGRAVMRLDDLYAKSIAGQDLKTALQAQREVNRLLDLYAGTPRHQESAGEEALDLRRRLELIASYLMPLELAAGTYPVEEHARLAAEVIRRHGHCRV